MIFVILAVAWAGYLIPRALRHHEEIAANRPVDSFSDTMRVLERTPATMKALLTPPAPKVSRKRSRRVPEAPLATVCTPAHPTLSATKGAARRRRRVLGLLLFATAATAGVAAFQYLPWVSVVAPGLLVVGWLVLCRLMVCKASVGHRRAVLVAQTSSATSVVEKAAAAQPVGEVVHDSGSETTSGEAALEDDGSLWDPLPLTLPTYVSKPAARRTVRTIDLTQSGITSAGHQAEDTRLARAAEADAKADEESGEGQQRKAAGA